jgi:quercetin dioxygenase-like cupin family protein
VRLSSRSAMRALTRLFCSPGMLLRCAAVLAALGAATVTAADAPVGAAKGDSDILFTAPLADVPGKHLVVVRLDFAPGSQKPSTPHRHPGSVYVYVTQGAVRWALNGRPPQVAHAGEGFFEPPGALHTVNENATPGARSSALAVMIVPDGAPLLTVDSEPRTRR